jgi:phospholipid transport system substrate-binding protein
MKFLNTTRNTFSLIMTAIILVIAAETWAEQFQSDNPEHVIATLQETLIQAMQQGQEIGFSGRLELLTPVINQSHDMGTIIRTVLGTHWNNLDPERQRTITKTFQEHSIATYADRFDQYDGERFEILEHRQLPRERILVRSQLIQADANRINFDYVLHQVDSSWRIINIVVDGVSDLALKRAEYNAILQKDDITALIDILEQKTAKIRQDR